MDRVRHRDHPVAPATTVAALVDPQLACTLGVPAGVERRPRRHRVHPVQRQIHVAAGLHAFFQQNGTDWDRSWRSPCSCLIRSSWSSRPGRPTTQPVDPVATTRPGAAGDTAESTPTQGKTTESKVTPSTKSDRPKVRDRIGSELHQVTDLVRSFTGGFTEPSMKATPGGADAKGTTAGATTTNGPSAEERRSQAASADAA